MKRLFLGLEFPKELASELEAFIEPYKTHSALKDAKWIPTENFHLTLLFLGEVPDSLVPEVQSLARGVCAKIPKFILQPKRVTLYPEMGKAKIVWTKFERSLEFQELCSELLLFLKHTLPDLEVKESIAHLTLARLRKTIDGKALTFKPIDFSGFEVTETALYQSELTPQGSVYTVLERYPHGA
ncbi:RNA 2',3'-cyclic phosphodiesterase [Candidatus Peregrinibacteria bacterium]|nr:MAG: RNA 2',3'-cyclic phosphodiesterase [Candidatus Peregrinibacteria bacterium]